MGNSVLDGRTPAVSSGGTITKFYTSAAWIEGRAEQQLEQVAGLSGMRGVAAFPDLHPGKYGPVGCAVLADRIYLKTTHVAVGFREEEGGYTDQRLSGMGHSRHVIAWTPRFASIPDLVTCTGAIATMPAPIARHHAARFGLGTTELPFNLDPVPVRLCWHERRRTDPLNAWLRDQVRVVVENRMNS